jgi:hypothetical protein
MIVIVNSAVSPAESGPLPTLSTVTSGQLTTTVSVEVLLFVFAPSFEPKTVAVFSRSAQSAFDVALLMTTV